MDAIYAFFQNQWASWAAGVNTLVRNFTAAFITSNRWTFFARGLGYTLLISLFSVILGLVIGIVMAFMRTSKSKLLRGISGTYIDIIRGTPTMVQLLIIYFVIFAQVNIAQWMVGVIAFGINSGAYIAEIVRGGILSVNIGQTEAGRSLGMTSKQTMMSIVMPQALKNILPALGNEFIVLIKETAVVGMISKVDLVGAAQNISSQTYDVIVPYLSIAVIYYVVIKILSLILARIEKRLRRSDKR